MAKPTSKPNWTVGNPDFGTVTQEPTAGEKQTGWLPNQRPPREWMNWLFFNLGEWLDYFEGVTDGLSALQSTYDVVIGVGGTHATLNDAVADAGVGENARVLVKDPVALAATQVLSKNGWELVFKPSAIYAQSGIVTPGIQITAERIKLSGCRFADFDGGSDVALELDATAKNCIIFNNSYFNCDVNIQDDGTNNALSNNINEV